MGEVFSKAHRFILENARLLERRLFEVHFENVPPFYVGQVVRAYQNPDGGLGHGLEADVRCSESQSLFVSQGLAALEEVGYRDVEFATTLCDYLESISDDNGLLPIIADSAFQSPIANHWNYATITPALNPTVDICGLLHFQGIQHDWLSLATETCCDMIFKNPPQDGHTLYGVSRLAEHIPDLKTSMNLLDVIDKYLPQASFYIAETPVETYGLTPLHFAPKPESLCRKLFLQSQIDNHLNDLIEKQLPDGGWPINWDTPGTASNLEWRGRCTLDALLWLSAYGKL